MELARTITRHMISKGYRRFLIFYPNSGELWDGIHATWIAGSGTNRPNEFAKIIKSTIDVVREEWQEGTLKGYVTGPPPGMIIGGCCRTSTDTIAAIRSLCFASTQ
jgi:S-methylmethionine-dependent homocysteine/selenocysteine methylase